MINKIQYLCIIFLSITLFAQNGKVGIGTSSPQQLLHIDASSNTNSTSNTSDDVVVTNNGYLGLGTTNPNNRVDINGKIKITDGTQQANAFLKSDINGVGTWYAQGSIKPMVLGTWPTSSLYVASDGDEKKPFKSLGVKLVNLTPGYWMINFGMCFKMNNSSVPFWLKLYLSDSASEVSLTNTTFDFANNSKANYAGLMIPNITSGAGRANLVSGSLIINVKETTTIYVLAQNVKTTSVDWNTSTGNWENYLYAMPLDGQ